jgi:hypothetical protein
MSFVERSLDAQLEELSQEQRHVNDHLRTGREPFDASANKTQKKGD